MQCTRLQAKHCFSLVPKITYVNFLNSQSYVCFLRKSCTFINPEQSLLRLFFMLNFRTVLISAMLLGYAVFILGSLLVTIEEFWQQQMLHQSLIEAVLENDNVAVSDLLLKGGEVDKRDDDGVTALMYAAGNGYSEVVSTLLSHNASLDLQNDSNGETALMYAARYGDNEVVSTLLAHKASVDVQGIYGSTALMHAVKKGHVEAASTLLAHNASVDLQTILRWTALTYAAFIGHNEIVAILLAYNSPVDVQDNKGKTALIMAAENGYNGIVSTLLAHNASLDILDNSEDKAIALMYAVKYGHSDVVSSLLKSGAAVEIESPKQL